MNSSYFCSDSVGIAQRKETRSYLRDIERKRMPIRNYGPFSLLTRADVLLAAPFFFHPLRISRGRYCENEWTFYPGLNLKHGRNGVRKAWLAWRDNFSSYRDAPTKLLQKRLLTDGDKRSMH